MQPLDRIDDHASGETPEDVAILYSWANLEGAKYRDFSANRREYRAQMRHRAAEQLRLMELRAQSEAEAAAAEAEAEAAAAHADADAASVKLAANRTAQASGLMKAAGGPEDLEAEEQVEHIRKSSLREAAQQARRAAAERLEAARRAEAAALADSIARREEREIAEAQASALRQAAQYAESEARGRQKRATQPEDALPGRISDPYGPQVVAEGAYFERPGTPVSELEAIRFRQQREYIEESTGVELPQFRVPENFSETPRRASQRPEPSAEPSWDLSRRPRGYWPDEAPGRRLAATDESLLNETLEEHFADFPQDFEPRRQPKPVVEERYLSIARDAHRQDEAGALHLRREQNLAAETAKGSPGPEGRRVVPSIPYKEFRRTTNGAGSDPKPEVVSRIPGQQLGESGWHAAEDLIEPGHARFRGAEPTDHELHYEARERWVAPTTLPVDEPQTTQAPVRTRENGNGTGTQNGAAAMPPSNPIHDSWGAAWDRSASPIADTQPRWSNRPESLTPRVAVAAVSQAKMPVDSPGPAWLYPKTEGPRFVDSLANSGSRAVAQLAVESLKAGSGETVTLPARKIAASVQARGAVEETLQDSREQVASRWFALKGVFARTDRDQKNDRQAAREQKRNTPLVVVYSLAGGVGKTSLVATLGRTLSSLGEKVLLTDTTSQRLLPFYFGASELHPGVVRTFSPPEGSSDAPIQLVSYEFGGPEREPARSDGEVQSETFDELVANSQTASRVVMDLDANCGWLVARLAWLKPTILVPLAADMNSVISLQAVERSFHGMLGPGGKALQPTYLLNQFDASLPLHIDVREVLKQQLGERLLPFVVRRASGVGEALAEGMTIVDYDPGAEVAKDYMGVANWLRTTSAPATVGFRNLRWSER